MRNTKRMKATQEGGKGADLSVVAKKKADGKTQLDAAAY